MNLNQNQTGEDSLAGRRLLHSNICTSKKLSSVSHEAENLYYRLLTLVDDDGNFPAHPNIVHGQCMSLRVGMTPEIVKVLLEELAEPDENGETLLLFYNIKSDRYLHFTRFHDFQVFRGDRNPYLAYPTHPKELGSTLKGGKPVVNQWYTNGKPSGTNGKPVVNHSAQMVTDCSRIEEKRIEENTNRSGGHVGFGFGDWKTMRVKYNTLMGTSHANSQKCKDEFQEACQTYGEEFVLSEFETWARGDGRWIVESPKSTRATKSFGLHHFYKLLPELLEVRKNIQADQTSQKESLEDLRSQESIIIARDEVELESKRKQIREDEELAANFHKQVLEEGF